MAIIKKVKHDFEENIYEIRVSETEKGYKVETFKDDALASPFSYTVSATTSQDMEVLTTKKGYNHLIDAAISDIENGFIYGAD